MVTITNNLLNTQALSLKSNLLSPTALRPGQLLTINVQPLNNNQAQITVGNQTLVAQTKQPITESGEITVRVKQTTPELQLTVVKQPTGNSNLQQQTIQGVYRQLLPVQSPITQVFQQISVLQNLPASLQGPVQQLLEQVGKNRANLDSEGLKQRLLNSGLFLESKLKNSAEAKQFKNDLKAQLLQLQQQASQINQSASNTSINKLSTLLNQALSRLTIQQVQLFENPNVTPLEIPASSEQKVDNDLIEIRKQQTQNFKSWEAYIDLQLELGALSVKLKLYEDAPLDCFIWCETGQLEQKVQQNLPVLEQFFAENQIEAKPIQIAATKPKPSNTSSKVALIDIKV